MSSDRAKEGAAGEAAAPEVGYNGQGEPSMEDILASIRRILTDDAAEQGSAAADPAPPGTTAASIAAETKARSSAEEEPAASSVRPARSMVREAGRAGSNVFLLTPEMRIPERRTPVPEGGAPKRKVMSSNTSETGTDVLAQLAGAILDRRDIAIGARDVTLESMVREMLRPLLREWLDRNLPYLIERLVKREIDLMVNRAERLED